MLYWISSIRQVMEIDQGGDCSSGVINTSSSLRRMLSKLNWETEPAIAVEDPVKLLDSFWVSFPPYTNPWKPIDKLRRKQDELENHIHNQFSFIEHVGSFPFFKTLYYAISSITDLKEDQYIKTDYPLIGGYVGYETGITRNEIEPEFRHVRKEVEKKLDELSQEVTVFWGHISEVLQYPNILYFPKDDSFLYAEVDAPESRNTQSIFFDYVDIVTSPLESRDPEQELQFRSYERLDGKIRRHELNPIVSDVKVEFEMIETDVDSFTVTESFDIPLEKLRLELRDSLAIVFMNEVK